MTRRRDQDDLHKAVQDEIYRLNCSIELGRVPILHAWGGHFPVLKIDDQMWAHCGADPSGLRPPYPFMLCNDNTWADLLAQAKVERNPLFQR